MIDPPNYVLEASSIARTAHAGWDGQLYDDYLCQLMTNEIARVVKIADIHHNLNGTPTKNQIPKGSYIIN